MILDYLPIIGPPISSKEKEQAERVWEALRLYSSKEEHSPPKGKIQVRILVEVPCLRKSI